MRQRLPHPRGVAQSLHAADVLGQHRFQLIVHAILQLGDEDFTGR